MHKCIRRARGEPRDPLKSHAGRSRPHCGCGQILRATCRVTSLSDGRAPSRPHAAAWGSSTEWRPRALKTEKVDSECSKYRKRDPENSNQRPWHCCLGRRRAFEDLHRADSEFSARESVSGRRTLKSAQIFRAPSREHAAVRAQCSVRAGGTSGVPFFKAKMLNPWHRS